MIFPLPADAAGTRGVLAIRAFMQPGDDAGIDSGGIHVAPTLAPRPESVALYHVQWWRTIAGYIVEVVEPLAMFLLIGMALAIRRRSSHPRFIAFVCIALGLAAVRRLDNAIVSWTDLMSLSTYTWLSKVLWMPLLLAAWTLAWNRWCLRSSRVIDAAALSLALIGIIGGQWHVMAMSSICRFGLLALLVVILLRIVRGGPMRLMASATMAMILVYQLVRELDLLGLPVIWFPFGIGVTLTQYIYAIAIPCLALLIAQTVPSTHRRPR